MATVRRRCERAGMRRPRPPAVRTTLRTALAGLLLALLAACGTSPAAEPDDPGDPGPSLPAGEFGPTTWNEATWQ
jgi:hypothetical protein